MSALGSVAKAICDYDYRCSALYASSLPIAVPITIIGIVQSIYSMACKHKKELHSHINRPFKRVIAITDLANGISGLIRPFCVSVVALSYFAPIEPIVASIAGPLSLAAGIGNIFYATSVIVRALYSAKKYRVAESSGQSMFHDLSDSKVWSTKELAYEFQSNGMLVRNQFDAVAQKLDQIQDFGVKAQKIVDLTDILKNRIFHRRFSDGLAVFIAVASIASAVCFFVFAGTALVPIAWFITLGVLSMGLGKYIYEQIVIANFQAKLHSFIHTPLNPDTITPQG
jgi:hypothetical protein